MRTIITDTAAIDKLIKGITKSSKKLDDDIQSAALAVAFHAHMHGNVMPLNELFKGLGKGARHSALTAWLLDAAPVTANSNKETKAEMPFVYDKAKLMKGEALDMLMAEHDAIGAQWFDRKPSPAPDMELDVRALIIALMRKVDKEGATIKTGQVELVHRLHEVFDPMVQDTTASAPAHA